MAVTAVDLPLPRSKEGTAQAAARVWQGRSLAAERQGSGSGPSHNAALNVEKLERHATPDATGAALLAQTDEQFALSARAYHRVLKVARTIADLKGSTGVHRLHIAEALSYRARSPQRQTANA